MQQKLIIILLLVGLTGVAWYFFKTQKEVDTTIPAGVASKIDASKILSGGPPKDGIPSIDNPKFWTVGEASKFLKDDDVVLGLEYEGEVRTYPLRILNWHEIVNDSINGNPILITYCPLCYTGIAFKREINGISVEFGVSGKLYNNNLLMYNRPNDVIKDESLWSQQLGEAVVGPLTGTKLEQIIIDTVTWRDWKEKHPDTKVLSTDTGAIRDYTVNPYGDYEFDNNQILFPTTSTDGRLPAKAKVYGIEIDGKFKAYPQDKLAKGTKIVDNFEGHEILITIDSMGAVRMKDKKTGGEIPWQISFWFSWVAFHPETEVFQ